jgi:choline dehydrogenase-like flavoprotein
MAVVDQYCSVKGISGLSVIDASVKPKITRSGGSHATVLMMAERAVEFVAPA